MIKISDNFRGQASVNQYCVTGCGNLENMTHIYSCEMLNSEKKITHQYEKIYNGTLKEQVEIYYHMKENLDKQEKLLK